MRLAKGRQESKSGWMWDCALTLGGRRGEIRSSILGLHSELEASLGSTGDLVSKNQNQ